MTFLHSLLDALKHSAVPRAPRAVRILISQPARLRLHNVNRQEGAMLEDLSFRGACIRTHLRLRAGDRVTLFMNLGAGFKFELGAQVIYQQPVIPGMQYRCGLRMLDVSADDADRLCAYISAQMHGSEVGVRAFSLRSQPA